MIPICKRNTLGDLYSELDFFYPVGCYFETSDTSFNPNEIWGGEWVQDTKGLTTVGAYEATDTDPDVNGRLYLKQGNITGEVNHTLDIKEMPEHKHTVNGNYGRDINSGGWGAPIGNNTGYVLAPENITNYLNYTGESKPHNNTQPSIGVVRWHRIN